MFEGFKKLFGFEPEADFRTLKDSGAQVIDVRTPEEFKAGHIPGSVNIPLQKLADSLDRISRYKPVITCCTSGIRSASAMDFLKSKDITKSAMGADGLHYRVNSEN